MKQLFLKTTLLLFAITFFNCEDNEPEDQLPPITQTGSNTFGAIVNGRVFVPKDKTGYSAPGGGTPRGLKILGNTRTFVIQATNYENIYIYIYIPQDLPKEQTYIFHNSTGVEYSLNEPDFAHIYAIVNGNKYLSFQNSGSISFSKISFDKGIYAGIFNARLKNEINETEIIEITNERFDI